jgi:hypothetical protein
MKALTIDKATLKTVEHSYDLNDSKRIFSQEICSQVHGLIGILGIYGVNYLVIAAGSKQVTTIPVLTPAGVENLEEKSDHQLGESKIYALTEVKLYPFESEKLH